MMIKRKCVRWLIVAMTLFMLMTTTLPLNSKMAGARFDSKQTDEWSQLLHSDRFEYGPEFFDQEIGRPYFDTEQFLQERSSPLLKELVAKLTKDKEAINEKFDRLFFKYGISPKVVFTLFEMRSKVVDGNSDNTAKVIDDPLSIQNGSGFYTQLTMTLKFLSDQYLYARDGWGEPANPNISIPKYLSPGDFALYSFADLLGYNISNIHGREEFAELFTQTYRRLFDDPLAPLPPNQQALLPRTRSSRTPASHLDTIAPPFNSPMGMNSDGDELLIPFRGAETSPYNPDSRHRGVDIVNAGSNVYATYSGTAYRFGNCAVYIEHDTLPSSYQNYVPTLKVRTYNSHLDPNSRIASGTRVTKGQLIGVKDSENGPCMYGDWHLHMSISPRGTGETDNAIDPSAYLGANLDYDKGARSNHPNIPAINYLDSIAVSDTSSLDFESTEEIVAWRALYPHLDKAPIGSIISDGISGKSGKVQGQSDQKWNDGLTFHLTDFQANITYDISFDAKSLGNKDGHSSYILLKSPSGCATKGTYSLDVGNGSVVRRSIEVTLGDA
jgi:murein DD-endopeptidase MepM/ murein hydrolase activator NlpD